MIGMSNTTGQKLDDLAHLRQSIQDILTTPIGTRVMRREYGSENFKFVDAPLNRGTIVSIIAASAKALRLWEPRIKVERIQITDASDKGGATLNIEAEYLPNGESVLLDGIVVNEFILYTFDDSFSSISATLSEGNTIATNASVAVFESGPVNRVFDVATAKVYQEFEVVFTGSNNFNVLTGLRISDHSFYGANQFVGQTATGWGMQRQASNTLTWHQSVFASKGVSAPVISTGSRIGVAVDNGDVWFSIDGTLVEGDLTNSPSFTGLTGEMRFAVSLYTVSGNASTSIKVLSPNDCLHKPAGY